MSHAPTPLVIATLPARSATEARRQAPLAHAAGADVAEVRFDRWPPDERARLSGLFPAPMPLLATLRSSVEGGEGPDDPATRRQWFSLVRQFPFDWVDVEADRDLAAVDPAASSPPGGWIISSHLRAGTTPAAVHARLASPRPASAVVKVVLPASVSEALRGLVPALPPIGEGRRILLTTGPSGPLLRAWCRRLDLAAVYGALPESAEAGPAVEPTQVPVDRLRWLLDGPAGAPLFGVVGRPIAHSLSPALHHHWMRAHGDRGLYVALEFGSESEFAESLEPLALGGFRGLNVTHPFKDAALRIATRAAEGAEASGCANTLTFHDGEIDAENTDLLAILRRLEELRGSGAWDGSALTVLGTGGAARATLEAARSLGVRAEVVGRRRSAVTAIASAFGAEARAEATTRPSTLVVNATTVGRGPDGPAGFDLARLLGPSSYLLDWVYRPDHSVMAEAARSAKATYEDGRRLLAYSAAASYEVWWDHAPSRAQVEAALSEVG